MIIQNIIHLPLSYCFSWRCFIIKYPNLKQNPNPNLNLILIQDVILIYPNPNPKGEITYTDSYSTFTRAFVLWLKKSIKARVWGSKYGQLHSAPWCQWHTWAGSIPRQRPGDDLTHLLDMATHWQLPLSPKHWGPEGASLPREETYQGTNADNGKSLHHHLLLQR